MKLQNTGILKRNRILKLTAKKGVVFLLLAILSAQSFAQQNHTISGTVIEKSNNEPIQYAAVGIKELNRWQYTDTKGNFSFINIASGTYTLVVHCLGYKNIEQEINFQDEWSQTIYLSDLNLKIKEVTVTAIEKANESGTSIINREAMQHLQPSSFGDLQELLPGYRWEKQDLSKINSISLRQVDNDDNTAYGTAFYVDGMPVSTDASMEGNNLSSTNIKVEGRINVANGIDMRQIPTDDIEQVEIIRGLPSVKQGNLSSGAIIITRKWGATHLTARAKTDLTNKVFAISKGINLGKNRGILNIGTELLSYKADPRNPLESYLRNQSSLRYSNYYNIGESTIMLKTGLDYLLTIDRDKDDPQLNYGMKDEYRSSLSKTDLSIQSKLTVPGNINKILALKIKASHTKNAIIREKIVSLTGPQPIPTATQEGKSYGEYLPSRYEANFERDDQPLNIYASLDFSLNGTQNSFRHQFNSGIDWQYLKNIGKGDQFDVSRPISPTQGGRPYNFSNVPALNNLSLYAEEELTFRIDEHRIKMKPGVRVQMLPGLSPDFEMHGKHFMDLRGHISYTAPNIRVAGRKVSVTVNAALGQMTRMPSLAMLYPQKEYFDIVELNYYSQNPDLRQLYVMTEIEDRTNYNLQPVTNLKKEIGLDAHIGKTRLSLSLFDEFLDNGIVAASQFVSYTYNYYDATSVASTNLKSPPTIDLFTSEEKSQLYNFSQYVNGSELHKKGLEYQLVTPKINQIQTRITISGAWFKTRYHISIPQYEKQSIIYKGAEFPYVGIFEVNDNDSEEKELLNTNFRFDTHLSQHRLLLTLAIQTTWYKKERYLPYDGTPIAYLDNKGNYHPYTEADKNDPILGLLTRTFTPYHFDVQKTPIDLGINLKVSKEVGDHLTFAFYVNRLINYLPEYKLRTGTTYIRSVQPYFGMELKFII
ncbi:TonB-dependent receptor [Geofilum sp. OHC36d9]|uniref:TonB-dependent receptor n=1 Tax=Geofilum sp. OHC36d9 TaxID=3458413 RepID=UPI0040349D19